MTNELVRLQKKRDQVMKQEASTRERLNLIRDRADALASELDALESGNAVPASAESRGASVSYPPSEILQDQRMPSNADLQNLLAIVHADYPSLRPSRAMDKDFIAFRLSARWLLDVKRGNLDLAHTVRFWADRAQGFSIFHSMKVEISGNILLCAAIAAGDVTFLDPEKYTTNLMHLGLKATGYGAGRPADQAWRQILATGRAPAASNYRPREYERGGVTIRCAE
jgi:hypothetical protein